MDLEMDSVCINDLNRELINVYEQIKEHPDKLIECLKKHEKKHCHDYYYRLRDLDRTKSFSKLDNTQKAARTIYLNRVCYNGLYRVNSKGQFNVPFGRYSKPEIVLDDRIHLLSDYLNNKRIRILNVDFEEAIKAAKEGDIVYLDPPYDYDSEGFTAYTPSGFSRADLERLKRVCDGLIRNGCLVIISNNDTKFVNKIFHDPKYKIIHVNSRWTIGRNRSSRKPKKEVIIYGKKDSVSTGR